MSENPKLQSKVHNLYNKIRNDLYLCRDDLTVSGEQYNSALLFGVLTQLNKGNQLLFGEYGGGKTTSAEYLNSVFNGLPLELVKRVAIRGNPQLTEEKLVGTLKLGKLMHEGEEEVVWRHFVINFWKIIDEFPRIPESNQAIVLNGVDRGEWNYLNEFISTGPQPFSATCNYSDRGQGTLIPPLLDRFDVAVESKFPGVANVMQISQDYHNEREQVLCDPKLTKEALSILNSGKSYDEVQKELQEIITEHEKNLSKNGFEVLTSKDKEQIEQEIKQLQLDKDAEVYFMFLVSEMNVSPKYGQKRSIDPTTAEHGLYLQADFIGSGSRREEKSIVRYAKSLAWLQNQDKVNLDHITQVAPYVLWHRVKWTDEINSRFRGMDRDDPLDLYITKTLLGDGTHETPGVKKRFVESKENYQRVIDLVRHGKLEKALEETKLYCADGKGHPIFLDTQKDLE